MKNQNNIKLASVNYFGIQKMIKEYQCQHFDDHDFLASEYFDVELIREIINNPKCKGIRVYNALNEKEDGTKQNRFIIMAEDENGKSILRFNNQLAAVSATSLGMSVGFIDDVVGVVENGKPCPPMCQ